MIRVKFKDVLLAMVNRNFKHDLYIKDPDGNFHTVCDVTIYGYTKVNCEDGYDTYVDYLLEDDDNSNACESVWIDN